jgi:N-acetyl sugar amidotransferase
MRYCAKCVYPASSAVPLAFDEHGVCSGCRTASQRQDVDWAKRKQMLYDLIDGYRKTKTGPYDLMIPVSGGKDSFFQVHTIKEMGFNPLLVTYHGNNYTPWGLNNLRRMRDSFDCDHIFFTPSVRVLKVLNRLGMEVMGDMNWHAHAGIFTYPVREAVLRKIPLMLWGEHGYADLGGMHSYKDFVEFTYKFRHEHGLRGYEWYDMVRYAKDLGEHLTSDDMDPWKYPCDDAIDAVGVRGVYLSNYVRWDANDHGPMMEKLYGFESAPEGYFERTYRRMSNLDDQHENGIHDYMKWIKFGYGRATDHVCKDIRAGLLTRDQGTMEVRKRDHIKPRDIHRWLAYVGWSMDKFDEVADRFRDKRVWWKDEAGNWCKDNIA